MSFFLSHRNGILEAYHNFFFEQGFGYSDYRTEEFGEQWGWQSHTLTLMKILRLKLEEVNEQNFIWCLNVLAMLKDEGNLNEHVAEQIRNQNKP